jgi:hypothetical protein
VVLRLASLLLFASGRVGALLLLGVLVVALPAGADGPILHEYIEPDEQEDLLLRTTTANGALPAAIDTPSGVVRAPDPLAPVDMSDRAYGGSSTPNSPDARYRIDRDTTRPDVVGYDDPFIPSVTPFKRLYAYDAVDESLELVVADKRLRPIVIGGGQPPGAADDQFFADLVVDLAANEAVRIPSVGPGARVLNAATHPPVRFELLRDGADNWFVRASERRRVRLIMQLAIERAVFGSDYPEVTYAQLATHLPPLPEPARQAGLDVVREVGIAVTLSPAAALEVLVDYFRSFAPSGDRPVSAGLGLYRDLALSQKGVCRHRSYAFVVTAQALGIPTRLVRNEAHAWVEVYDGRIWHRIDLGGAAGRLNMHSDDDAAQHVPPPDPFRWPEGSESGSDMASRVLAAPPGAGAKAPAAPTASRSAPQSPAPPPAPTEQAEVSSAEQAEDTRPAARFELTAAGGEVRRGSPLRLSGRVETDEGACEGVRVDVALRSETARLIPLGSLPAGANGRFDGAVTVRLDVPVGDYGLVVSTPGNASCGPGRGE